MAFLKMKFRSMALVREVDVTLVLPLEPKFDFTAPKTITESYQQEEAPYKTLYLLHGFCGDQDDWTRFSNVERYAMEKRLAVIMPAGYNGGYMNHEETDQYWTFLTEELPLMVAKTFPISTKREDTFVAGLSMGGYGTLRFSVNYPERFSYAVSLSMGMRENSIETKDDRDIYYMLKQQKEAGVTMPKYYICCGTEDLGRPGSENYGGHGGSKRLCEYMQELGMDAEFYDGPGKHEWDFWDTFIRRTIYEWLPL